MRTITLEEHFHSQRLLERAGGGHGGPKRLNPASREITDLGELRLKSMDESGIDLQVVSHTSHVREALPPDVDLDIARMANDQLAAAVGRYPARLAGFAALPMSDTAAAVAELDRSVTELGFKGALILGRPGGRFLDHPSLFPVLERAHTLGVPLYVHPGLPTAALQHDCYAGFGAETSYFLGTAAWGWHAETGLHALRMIVARIFDRLPDLQVIIGHMGEMIPVMLDRVDELLTPAARNEGLRRSVADAFHSNFWVTTSGMFSVAPFLLLLQSVGADRIMFSVDYPFSSNRRGREFLDALEIAPGDKEKISHLNAERLLNLPGS
jgi:uncharacterized protein